MAHKDEVGRRGEDYAAQYLTGDGYRIVARNWRCSEGEIDVIVERDGVIAFVEVKTRSSTRFGHPFEAITVVKLARMRRLAAAWCQQAEVWPPRIRIDAIAVISRPGSTPVVEHLKGVF